MNLLQTQQALLADLFANKPSASALSLGLSIYRANAHALAERALASTFPVIQQLLGEDAFNPMARHFWHAHPPSKGDMAQWGAALPAFLASNPQLQTEPYLADVASAEWLLHREQTAADSTPDPTSFALLGTQNTNTLRLQLAPGLAVVSSPWPLSQLLHAHGAGCTPTQTPTSLSDLAPLVQAAHANATTQTHLVWRATWASRIAPLNGDEAAFFAELLHEQALDQALEATTQAFPSFDAAAFLQRHIPLGTVLGVASR